MTYSSSGIPRRQNQLNDLSDRVGERQVNQVPNRLQPGVAPISEAQRAAANTIKQAPSSNQIGNTVSESERKLANDPGIGLQMNSPLPPLRSKPVTIPAPKIPNSALNPASEKMYILGQQQAEKSARSRQNTKGA